jgi:hypothetical protein
MIEKIAVALIVAYGVALFVAQLVMALSVL